MRTKGIILIITVIIMIIAIVGIGVGLNINQEPEYKTITINDIIMEVPDVNGTIDNRTEEYIIYNDSATNLTIYTFDSEGADLNDASEMVEFAAYREAYQVGAKTETKDNVSYNYSDTSKIYSYVGNYTHKNILIATTNQEVIIHLLQTMKLDPNANTTENDTNDNVTYTSYKTTSSSSSESNYDSDYDPERDASHQGATEDNPITVQQSDGEYTYYGPGHYDYYAGPTHMSGEHYKSMNNRE